MGFFKDLNTLSKQGKELQKNMDVKARMEQGMANMQMANTMIQQQTYAAHMAVHGIPSTATVVAVRPTGAQLNFDPVLDVDLTVFRNGVPVPATVRQPVPQVFLSRLQPGALVNVRLDPNDPNSVVFAW
jgi:hypothetical protein